MIYDDFNKFLELKKNIINMNIDNQEKCDEWNLL